MVPTKGNAFVSSKLNYCKFRDLEQSGFTVRTMLPVRGDDAAQTASAGLA